jgi:hypothetical protein
MVIFVLKLSHLTQIHPWLIAKYPVYPSPIPTHSSLLANRSCRSQFAPTKASMQEYTRLKLRRSSVEKFSRCPLFPKKNYPKNGHWRYSFHFSLFFHCSSLVLSLTILQEARLQILSKAISFEVWNWEERSIKRIIYRVPWQRGEDENEIMDTTMDDPT